MLFGSYGLNFNQNFKFLKDENDDLNENKNKQVAQRQYVVSDARCPALSDCELEGGGSRAAAPKGTKSCRTQGDFRSSCLRKGMRCYRGLTKGLQEPKLRSKKVDIRPKNANWKLERADLRLGRAGSRLEIRKLI